MLITMLIWYVIGVILMFNGDALRDTIGLVVVLIETIFVFVKDRHGLATLSGALDWQTMSKAQRIGLAVVEVVFFEFTLGIYLVREVLIHSDLLAPPSSH